MNPPIPKTACPKIAIALYHVERAKAGVALTMTAGSAAVSKDSPPVFNNILAYKDEVVGWMKKLTDECHEHGAAVMIQLTHLGRRTRWDKGDWLPTVSASAMPANRHIAPFPRSSKIGISTASSPITPMPPNGCRRRVWMGSSWNVTATCWISSCRPSPTHCPPLMAAAWKTAPVLRWK